MKFSRNKLARMVFAMADEVTVVCPGYMAWRHEGKTVKGHTPKVLASVMAKGDLLGLVDTLAYATSNPQVKRLVVGVNIYTGVKGKLPPGTGPRFSYSNTRKESRRVRKASGGYDSLMPSQFNISIEI